MLSLSYSLPTPPPFEAVIKSIKGTTFNHFNCLLFNKVTNALDMCLRGKDNVIIYDVNNKHILRHRSVSCKELINLAVAKLYCKLEMALFLSNTEMVNCILDRLRLGHIDDII